MAIKYVECSTIEVLGQTIGQLFIDQVKNQPHSVFILATGSSPLSVYQYLVHDYQVNKTD
jgi:6-phosphogluconolactonase/glucosamine-6-phosphate isomerase/deaminase